MPVFTKCKVCESVFSVKPSKLKAGHGKYCSKSCYVKSLKGKKPPYSFPKGFVPKNKKPVPPKNKLEALYLGKKLSISQIGREYKVSSNVVYNWLKTYQIPRRTCIEGLRLRGWRHNVSTGERRKIKVPKEELEEFLRKYETLNEIAKASGISVGILRRNLKEHGFPQRRRKHFIDKETLETLYWQEKMSTKKISEKLGIGTSRIDYWFRRYKIKRRTVSESIRVYLENEGEEHKRKRLERNAKSRIGLLKGSKNPMFGRKRPDFAARYGRREDFELKKFKALKLRPTKPENKLIKIISGNNFPLEYVGDGKVIIGGKNPDFIHLKTKKVVEVFGRVFHDPKYAFNKSLPWHQTYEGVKKFYREQGFECLVFWEDELNEEAHVIDELINFLR